MMKMKELSASGGGNRESSIELFRIVAMLVIIAHHFIVNSGVYGTIKEGDILSFASIFSLIFGSGGKTGINCFVLITGYFMCKSDISVRKYLKLLFEIEFYLVGFMLIFYFTEYESYKIEDIIRTIIPFYYVGTEFLSTYLIFYFFIPFINLFIKSLDERSYKKLLVMLLLFDSVLQTLIRLPNTFTYFGWFFTVYLIAAYIRMCRDGDYINKKKIFCNKKIWMYSTLVMIILSWLSIIAGAYIYLKTGKDYIYHFVIDSNKILSIMTAVSAFLLFLNIHIKQSRIINMVASSIFGILLIHANSAPMRRWLWKDVIDCVGRYQYGIAHPIEYILQAIAVVFIVFTVCAVIDILRIFLIEKPFMKFLDAVMKDNVDLYQ